MISYRQEILDAFRLALGKITLFADDATRGRPMFTDDPLSLYKAGHFPFVTVGVVSEDYVRQGHSGAVGRYQKTLNVTISYLFQSPSPQTEASRAIGDIEYALRDHTLGGKVDDLTIVSNTMASEESGASVVTMQVEVYYHIDENNPGART